MTIASRFMLAFIALTIGGCASSPVTLVVLPPPAVPASDVRQGPGGTILLRQLSVPGYLEDFPVVIGRAGNALVVSGTSSGGNPCCKASRASCGMCSSSVWGRPAS